jgi:uncharacterized protein
VIEVEICYALPDEQFLQAFSVSRGYTVIKAIIASGLLERFPEIQLKNNIGIFSKKVSLTHILEEGDRIEIYRPLLLTPNQARLRRRIRSKDFCGGLANCKQPLR